MNVSAPRPNAPWRVLVLQAGTRPGPWTCRSLSDAHCHVIAAHDGRIGGLTGRSRWCAQAYASPSPDADAEGYLEWVRKTASFEGVDVVVPLTESVTHLLAYADDLGGARRAGPGGHVYGALCDKDGLARTCSEAGVLTPKGRVVDATGRGRDEIPAAPCVVKPLASSTPFDGRMVYLPAVVVHTRAERDAQIARGLESVGAVMVQELVTGRRWRLHVARGPGGFAAIAWETLTSQPRDSGMSSVSRLRTVPLELARGAARLLSATGYRGVGSFQAIENEKGFVIHDVNLRLIFTVGASIRVGLDLPRMAVEIALGGDPEFACPARIRPLRYVSLSGELRALKHAGRHARIREAALALAELAGAAALPDRMLDPFDARTVIDLLRARRRAHAARRP